MRLTVTAAALPNLQRRTIAGTLFRYGETGITSAGPLRVEDPDAIQIPANLAEVTLTQDHDRSIVRGNLALVDDNGERLYVVNKVIDGELGDAALTEADPAVRVRAALSFDLEDAEVTDGVITSARLVAIGQVADPAFNSARIDQIAAAKAAGASRTNKRGNTMTEAQIARLAELRAQDNLSSDEAIELVELAMLEASENAENEGGNEDENEGENEGEQQPQAVAAARRSAAVPRGVPSPRRSRRSGSALTQMYSDLTRALKAGRSVGSITAALADVTNTGNPSIEAPAWSGELWSGLQYTPKWTSLFAQGDLTSWEGSGWRWTTKPSMEDYAGDKAAIPSAALGTESSGYEAARMACGHDIDRKFYDFPNAEFLASYAEAAREDWAMKLDAKVKAYALAQATAYPTADPDTDSLLKAVALAVWGVEDNTNAQATFVAVSRADMLGLLDVNADQAPAFLDLFNIDPSGFVVDSAIPAGTVLAGVKQAATVRTLPGSPIRVDAQHIANGGVDTAFFGYWAIEEHHTTGIVKATFA